MQSIESRPRDGKLYPGSGRPPTRPDPVRKAQLQRKLDKKLGEMSDGRKVKKKADDTGRCAIMS